MAVDANIGTIAASVRLDLGGLIGDKAKAEQLLQSMSVNITQNLNQTVKSVSSNMQAMAAQQTAAMNKIGNSFMAMGGSILGGLGAAVKVGADFEAMMNHMANNTSLTTDQIQGMREAVIKLGSESGAPLEQLATGFMKVSNFGFQGADATKLLDAAMKSAVATGGDVGKTAEILANVMHEFSIKTEDASRVMNMLHVEANKGNMTLDQFTQAAGPAFAMAANLGVSVNEASAAMAALTEHGFNASNAATQVKGMLQHIISPSVAATNEIKALSKATGIDLVHDFSIAGLSSKGLSGVLEDIKAAADKAHIGVADLIKDLIPAMRGGIGAMTLAGTGAEDFKNRLLDAEAAMSGKLDPTTEQYKKTLGTLTQQVAITKNNMVMLSDDIQKVLLPAINGIITSVGGAIREFHDLDPELKNSYINTTAFAGGALLGVGALMKLNTAVAAIRLSLGALLAAELGPVFLAIGAAAVAFGGLKLAIDYLNPSIEETDRQELKLAQTTADSAQKKSEDAQKVKELTAKYYELAGQTSQTHDVHVQMKQILDEIARLNPSYIKGYDAQGHAVDLLGDSYKRATQDADDFRQASLKAAAAVHFLTAQQDANQIHALRGELQKQQAILSSSKVHTDDQASINYTTGESILIPGHDDSASNADKIKAAKNIDEIHKKLSGLTDHAEKAWSTAQGIAQTGTLQGMFKNWWEIPDLGDSTKSPPGHGGGSGKPDKGHDKAVQDAKDSADKIAQINQDLYSKLFDLTHTDGENKAREYAQDLQNTKDNHGNMILAWKLYFAQINKLEKDGYDKLNEMSAQANAADKKLYLQKAMQRLSEGLQLQNFQNQADDHDREAHAKKIENQKSFLSRLQEGFSNQHDFDVEQTQQEKEEMDKRRQFDFEMNYLSFEDYYTYLEQRINATKAYTNEWYNIMRTAQDAIDKHNQPLPSLHNQKNQANSPFKPLAEGMANVFENSFNNIFQHGFKGFMKNMVDGMAQMVEQMIAKWAAFEIITGIFGAGIFGGGKKGGGGGGGIFGSMFDSLGFDNGANDRAALRWGFDFANSFRGGMASNVNQRSFIPAGATAGAGGGMQNTVHVNIDNVHVHDDRDIRQLSESVGWHITQQLRAKVGKQ